MRLLLILLFTTTASAQVEYISPEVVLNPDTPAEALYEQSEYLNFERISPGNYLLTNKYVSKELTQEQVEEIHTYFAKAVSFTEPSKQYTFSVGVPPMLAISRRNTAIDPFTGDAPQILIIQFRTTTEVIDRSGYIFFMSPDQGAKLLEQMDSILE